MLASGNMGLVYLTDHKKRLTYEEINHLYPDLIPGMVGHEGVGFILTESNEHGPMAICNGGKYYLENDTVEVLTPWLLSPHANRHLRRTNNFKYTPDILAISLYDPEKNEVAAFEELVGSHGG